MANNFSSIEILTKAAFKALIILTTPRGKGKRGKSGKGKGSPADTTTEQGGKIKGTSTSIAATLQRLMYSVKVSPMLFALPMIHFEPSQKGTVENIRLHDNEDFTAALLMLLAVHYVFNIQYDSHLYYSYRSSL